MEQLCTSPSRFCGFMALYPSDFTTSWLPYLAVWPFWYIQIKIPFHVLSLPAGRHNKFALCYKAVLPLRGGALITSGIDFGQDSKRPPLPHGEWCLNNLCHKVVRSFVCHSPPQSALLIRSAQIHFKVTFRRQFILFEHNDNNFQRGRATNIPGQNQTGYFGRFVCSIIIWFLRHSLAVSIWLLFLNEQDLLCIPFAFGGLSKCNVLPKIMLRLLSSRAERGVVMRWAPSARGPSFLRVG